MLWSVCNEMLQKGALWVRHVCLSVCLFTSAFTTRGKLIGSSENFARDSCIKTYRNIQNLFKLRSNKHTFCEDPHAFLQASQL